MADRRAADDPFIMDLFDNVTSPASCESILQTPMLRDAKESYGVSDPEVRGLFGRIRTETG